MSEEVETVEYCVRCAIKHLMAAQDALTDASKSGDVECPVRPKELDGLVARLVPLSETAKECRKWNIPEEHMAECSTMLGQFWDREVGPEEFAASLTRWTGKRYKVERMGEAYKITPE